MCCLWLLSLYKRRVFPLRKKKENLHIPTIIELSKTSLKRVKGREFKGIRYITLPFLPIFKI